MSSAAILDFFEFEICNRPNGHEGRTASLCYISLKSLKLQPRHGDFSKWRPPPSCIFEIINFYVCDDSYMSICVTLPNFVAIGQTVAEISRFFKMAASAILDF